MVAALTKLIFDNGIGVGLIIILDKPMVTAKALKDNPPVIGVVDNSGNFKRNSLTYRQICSHLWNTVYGTYYVGPVCSNSK